MKKSIFALAFTLLTSCITTGKTAVEFAGKDFNHTGSMCMDALLANMDRDSCPSPVIAPGSGYVLVHCNSSTESFWNNNVFLIVPGTQAIFIEAPPICMDFNYALFLYSPENNQEE